MSKTIEIWQRWFQSLRELPRRVHHNEEGTISIASVFAVLMFTMLMVMNINFATHVDDKLKMQNAADAAAYSGGVVLARGMNGIAFSNHLLADVFAMTAFLREADQRNAEQITPQIFDAWEEAGNTLVASPFLKFRGLGQAIIRKVPQERELVESWAEMSFASAEISLDVFEHILEAKLIPNFQREALRTVPEIAQDVVDEVARQHGLGRRQGFNGSPTRLDRPRNEQAGVMWQTRVVPLGTEAEYYPLLRTLPVVDPDPEESDYLNVPYGDEYFETAVAQRRQMARHYLNLWNFDRLSFFRVQGKMSTYFHLWRIATCGQLEQLLNVEYPRTNLPMIIRRMEDGRDLEAELRRIERQLEMTRRNYSHHPVLMDQLRQEVQLNDHLENNFHFVVAVYRKHQREFGPGMFQNPLRENQDALAFSQVSLFIPQARMRQHFRGQGSGGSGGGSIPLGGTFGYASNLDLPAQAPPAPAQPFGPNDVDQANREFWGLENWPTHWDLLNQNWMVQLVPASAQSVRTILRTPPDGEGEFNLPEFYYTSEQEFEVLNNH
ncbi:MAG: hypothetical protein CMJ78_00455 [Planctomycetaceae bacterium]|nr:hypothetical protein [Planctomycetaceae bacterium]